MAWHDIPTYTGLADVDDIADADEVSHEHFNEVAANLDETMPGKATALGQIFYATDENEIATFAANSSSTRKYLQARNSTDDPPLEWKEIDDYFDAAIVGSNRFYLLDNNGDLKRSNFFNSGPRLIVSNGGSGAFTYPSTDAEGLMISDDGDPNISDGAAGGLLTANGTIAIGTNGDILIAKGISSLPEWTDETDV